MPNRFTVTEKWNDPWLRSRKPAAKLLWVYLCDVCDVAGFWEIDLERAAFDTGLSKAAIQGAFKGLDKGYERNGRYIWLRNFIKYQGNLPLNKDNRAHRGIIRKLQENIDFSKSIGTILNGHKISRCFEAPSKGVETPARRAQGIGIGIGKGLSKGKEAQFEKFWKEYPHKKDKDAARKAWAKLEITDELVVVMIKAVGVQIQEKEDLTKAGEFCPSWCHGATWLNHRRWEDGISASVTKATPEDELRIMKEKGLL